MAETFVSEFPSYEQGLQDLCRRGLTMWYCLHQNSRAGFLRGPHKQQSQWHRDRVVLEGVMWGPWALVLGLAPKLFWSLDLFSSSMQWKHADQLCLCPKAELERLEVRTHVTVRLQEWRQIPSSTCLFTTPQTGQACFTSGPLHRLSPVPGCSSSK